MLAAPGLRWFACSFFYSRPCVNEIGRLVRLFFTVENTSEGSSESERSRTGVSFKGTRRGSSNEILSSSSSSGNGGKNKDACINASWITRLIGIMYQTQHTQFFEWNFKANLPLYIFQRFRHFLPADYHCAYNRVQLEKGKKKKTKLHNIRRNKYLNFLLVTRSTFSMHGSMCRWNKIHSQTSTIDDEN